MWCTFGLFQVVMITCEHCWPSTTLSHMSVRTGDAMYWYKDSNCSLLLESLHPLHPNDCKGLRKFIGGCKSRQFLIYTFVTCAQSYLKMLSFCCTDKAKPAMQTSLTTTSSHQEVCCNDPIMCSKSSCSLSSCLGTPESFKLIAIVAEQAKDVQEQVDDICMQKKCIRI